MVEKVVYESEWKEAYMRWDEKKKELKTSCFQLQKVGQRRIDHFKNEIEEIPHETPKTKARDKIQKLEGELYRISDEAEGLSAGDIVDKGLKDIGKRVQAYKSNETIEQKEKGECNE